MMFDKRKAASMIIDGIHKQHEEREPGSESLDSRENEAFHGLHAAAQEMIDAIHNRNPQDLHKSLRSFLDQHADMQPSEGSREESPDGSEMAHDEQAHEQFRSEHWKPGR